MKDKWCNKIVFTKAFPLFIIIIITIFFTYHGIGWANNPNQKKRAIAVMIGNSHEERAVQKGLSEADAIYEIEVEFPFTRLMAFFLRDTDTAIGPVRSSRYYFSRICAEWSAIFAHCGGQSLRNINVLDIDEMHYPSPYWRDDKIGGWINLFTSTTELREDTSKLHKYSDDSQDNHHLLKFKKPDANSDEQILKITIKYHTDYIVSYEYHPDEKKYYSYINQDPHLDLGTYEQIKASNIVMQFTPIEKVDGDDQGRIQVGLIGEGIGRVFNGGSYQSIKWIKKTKDDQTLFLDSNGNPITYDRGVTWIHILSTESEIWFK